MGDDEMMPLPKDAVEDALARVYELAFSYERDYGCCSQCVLAALDDVLGVGNDELVKASHALAGGGALTVTGTCGALAGALLAVGSQLGRERAAFGRGSPWRLREYTPSG